MKNRRKNRAKKKLLAIKEKEETDPSKWENIAIFSSLNIKPVNVSKQQIKKITSLIQWGNFKLSKNINVVNMLCNLKFEMHHLINQITFLPNFCKLTIELQSKVNLMKLEKEIIAL